MKLGYSFHGCNKSIKLIFDVRLVFIKYGLDNGVNPLSLETN